MGGGETGETKAATIAGMVEDAAEEGGGTRTAPAPTQPQGGSAVEQAEEKQKEPGIVV